MSLIVRKYISKSLSEANIKDFIKYLDSFYTELKPLYGVKKFQRTLDFMFSIFLSRNTEIDPTTGKDVPCFPMGGNLDTGDAHGFPPISFVKSLKENISKPNEYRKYYGPEAVPHLKELIKNFLVNQELIQEDFCKKIDIAIGSGTVNIYDNICRKIIKRPHDTILIPVPTYGFFIPQIYRAQGVPYFIKYNKDGKLDFDYIESIIDERNKTLTRSWVKNLEYSMGLYLNSLSDILKDKKIKSDKKYIKGFFQDINIESSLELIDCHIEDFIKNKILGSDQNAISIVEHNDELRLPDPPRVTGFLHINPTVFGTFFDEKDIDLATPMFNKKNILVIEDLAYYGIECQANTSKIASFIGKKCPYISLLGISKPFSIANLRVGIAISTPERVYNLMRRIENSIGFISSFLQNSLVSLFSATHKEHQEFFSRNNFNIKQGYSLKRKLMIFGLEGLESSRLSDEEKKECLSIYKRELKKFFSNKKKKYFIEIIDEDYLNFKKINSEQDLATLYQLSITNDFFLKGLSEWFELIHVPTHGFFTIVDCSKLINDFPYIQKIPIRSSFDVFALLAFFLGVRSIPAEVLGIEKDPNLLRFAFSSDVSLLTTSLFCVFVGLKQLIESKSLP